MHALTKILIVLSMVFTLVCSVLLVLLVSQAKNYKADTDAAVTRALAAQTSLADLQRQIASVTAQLNAAQASLTTANNAATQAIAEKSTSQSASEATILNLKSQIATLSANVASLTAANNTLAATNGTQSTELTTLRPMVSKLTTDNSEVSRALAEATNQLRAATLAIRKLQEQQVANTAPAGGAAAPMGSEGQVSPITSAAPTSGKVNGQVTQVDSSVGRTSIGIPLGTRDGIQVNTKLYVYRGNSYVADAQVARVTPEESVAVVTRTKQGETVQKGDLVSTLGQ